VSEHQAPDVLAACLLGDGERGRVAPSTVSEPDRTSPARRVGEHKVRARGPARELQELGCPHDPPACRLDDIAEGRMRGVDFRLRRKA